MQLVEDLQLQSSALVQAPLERCFDVEISGRLGDKPVAASLRLLREAIEDVVGGPCSIRVTAVGREPLLRQRQMALGDGKLARMVRDAVPKGLQLADLLRLRQLAETRGVLDRGPCHASPRYRQPGVPANIAAKANAWVALWPAPSSCRWDAGSASATRRTTD